MKNKIITLIAAITLCCTSLQSQTPDTATTEKLLHYIMQPLDKSQITTGFLQEWGCPMLPMATFNGTLTDSNRIDMNLWRTLYLQLQTSHCALSTNPLPNITQVNAAIKQNTTATSPTPIPLIIGQYNTVKSNAFTNNLLSYNASTKQVFDVAGRTQNPYQFNNLFAACPNVSFSKTGSETFIINSNLVWNNTGKSINQMEIDFADGNGFQNLTIGTAITISYSSIGKKRWTIKTTLSDNSVLQCYSNYYVAQVATTSSAARFINANTFTWTSVSLINNGALFGANVNLCFSRNSPTSPRRIRKPLIIVEGYDVSAIAPNTQPNYNVGDFIRGINEPQGYDFNQQLDDIAGYDLIFIDFWNGAADIVGNSLIVEEVIRQVNAAKVPDNRFGGIIQQNVVMGLSMGGLCARYALAHMTKNNQATGTRLLITHDSPHKGANVPLGLQYLIQMMGGFQIYGYDVRDIYPQYDEALNLLNAPATQQMLLYRATNANNFAANTFLDGAYKNMVTFSALNPQPTYRFIATSNGNECAQPIFNPSYTFFNFGAGIGAGVEVNLLFFSIPIVSYNLDAQVEAYALPNTGSTAKIARLYTRNQLQLFGFINIFKQLYDNTAYAPGNHIPIDGVPGSTSNTLDLSQLATITNLPAFDVNLNVAFPVYGLLSGYVNVYAYNNSNPLTFTFVPVGSALDVSPFGEPTFAEKYYNGYNDNYPSSSETFIAQETVNGNPAQTNNAHIRFTARNAHWLFNEMENILPNMVNCLQTTQATCPAKPLEIKGVDVFCSGTKSFYIPHLPRGASVSWSTYPSGIVTPPPYANSSTLNLTKIGTGEITMVATSNGFCNSNNPLSKTIAVGGPPSNILILGMKNPNPNITAPTTWSFSAPSFTAATYMWYLDGSKYLNTGSENFLNLLVPCNTQYNVQCKAMNACGMSNLSNAILTTKGYCKPKKNSGISTFPIDHPIEAPKKLNITVATTSSELFGHLFYDKESLANEMIQGVNVYNKKGELVMQTAALDTKATQLDFTELPDGTYFIEVLGKDDFRELHTFYYSSLNQEEYILDNIANGSIVINGNRAAERLYVMQQKLFNDLQCNYDAMNSSTTLQDFAKDNATGSFGYIWLIQNALGKDDIAGANNLLERWETTNAIDNNFKNYYIYYIKTVNNVTLETEELQTLHTIAQGCPLTDGEIVYAARDLYNYLEPNNTDDYSTACSSIGLRMANSNTIETINKSKANVIYPNPSKGNITIDNLDYGSKTITITNIYGKSVMQQQTNNKALSINLKLNAGVYFVNIANNKTGKTETQKLIIQ